MCDASRCNEVWHLVSNDAQDSREDLHEKKQACITMHCGVIVQDVWLGIHDP